jgi:hypothetical protein
MNSSKMFPLVTSNFLNGNFLIAVLDGISLKPACKIPGTYILFKTDIRIIQSCNPPHVNAGKKQKNQNAPETFKVFRFGSDELFTLRNSTRE